MFRFCKTYFNWFINPSCTHKISPSVIHMQHLGAHFYPKLQLQNVSMSARHDISEQQVTNHLK